MYLFPWRILKGTYSAKLNKIKQLFLAAEFVAHTVAFVKELVFHLGQRHQRARGKTSQSKKHDQQCYFHSISPRFFKGTMSSFLTDFGKPSNEEKLLSIASS